MNMHAIYTCFSIRHIYEDLAKELKIDDSIRKTISLKPVLIWNEGKSSKSGCSLCNPWKSDGAGRTAIRAF